MEPRIKPQARINMIKGKIKAALPDKVIKTSEIYAPTIPALFFAVTFFAEKMSLLKEGSPGLYETRPIKENIATAIKIIPTNSLDLRPNRLVNTDEDTVSFFAIFFDIILIYIKL